MVTRSSFIETGVVLCGSEVHGGTVREVILKTHLLMLEMAIASCGGSRETVSPSFSGHMHITDNQKLEETSTSKVYTKLSCIIILGDCIASRDSLEAKYHGYMLPLQKKSVLLVIYQLSPQYTHFQDE